MAVVNRRESGKEMEMGFPSGSVVLLPTANRHAKEKIAEETCIPQNYFIPPPFPQNNRHMVHSAVDYIKIVGTPLKDNQACTGTP